MIIDKFCNKCKKKISSREADIPIEKLKDLIESKDYCENCK